MRTLLTLIVLAVTSLTACAGPATPLATSQGVISAASAERPQSRPSTDLPPANPASTQPTPLAPAEANRLPLATSGSVDPSPANPAARPGIRIVYAAAQVPAQVHVDLTGLYPPPDKAQDLPVIVTDFGDPASAYDRVPGPFSAAHVYQQPGTYTIAATVDGVPAGSTTVTIADADRAACYVSSAGDDASPGTIDEPYRTLAGAIRGRLSIGARPPGVIDTAVLLRSGDTFEWKAAAAVLLHNVVIGSYGPATRPVLRYTGARSGSPFCFAPLAGSSGVTIRDLVFDSAYAARPARPSPAHLPTTQPGAESPAADQPVADTDFANCNGVMIAGVAGCSVLDCRFLNIDYGVETQDGTSGVLVQGCDAPQITTAGATLPPHADDTAGHDVTGLRANFFYSAEGSYICLLGNTVANSTREHCFRFDGGDYIATAGNDLTNLSRQAVDRSDICKATINDHVGLRHSHVGNVLRFGTAGTGPLNLPDIAKAAAGAADHARYLRECSHACRWIVYDANTFFHVTFDVQPGSEHVLIRGNAMTVDGQPAIVINGYDSNYSRLALDVAVIRNHAANAAPTGQFIRLAQPKAKDAPLPPGQKLADGITLSGNTYRSPNLQGGLSGNAPVTVEESDLSSFAAISGNTWTPPATIDRHARGGVMYVNQYPGQPEGWWTPERWSANPKVSGDRFEAMPATRPGADVHE